MISHEDHILVEANEILKHVQMARSLFGSFDIIKKNSRPSASCSENSLGQVECIMFEIFDNRR